MSKLIKKHIFKTEPCKEKDSEGDYLEITTLIYRNEAGEPYLNQFIDLVSAYDDGAIQLGRAALTPKQLREFADQLEEAMNTK